MKTSAQVPSILLPAKQSKLSQSEATEKFSSIRVVFRRISFNLILSRALILGRRFTKFLSCLIEEPDEYQYDPTYELEDQVNDKYLSPKRKYYSQHPYDRY